MDLLSPTAALAGAVLVLSCFFLFPGSTSAQDSRDSDSARPDAREGVDRSRSPSNESEARPSREPSRASKGNSERGARSATSSRPESNRDRSTGGNNDVLERRDLDKRDSNPRDTNGREADRRTGERGTVDRRTDGRSGEQRTDNRKNDPRTSNRGTNTHRRDDRFRRDNERGQRRGDAGYDRRGDRRVHDGRIIIDRRPPAHARARPHIFIDIAWPWIHRHERRWSPRYRYRQMVHVDAGWGPHRRESRLELRTYYRHRVRNASSRRARIDVFIERIEIFEDGFFIGDVNHIPDRLARTSASVDRSGRVLFDRDLFLLGDPDAGFELISTRHYDGFILNKYKASHGVRAGVLDLRRQRVVPVNRSRFFDPRSFDGFVPINLLPDDPAWIIDYGHTSYSGVHWGNDARYYYGFDDVDVYSGARGSQTSYSQVEPRGATAGRGTVPRVHVSENARAETSGRAENSSTQPIRVTPERQALERADERTYETENGARIQMSRETSIERID